MVTSDTYSFVEKKDDPSWYVKIKEGEYKDITFADDDKVYKVDPELW